MVEVVRSKEFIKWLKKLPDRRVALGAAKRIKRIENGNFGHVERLTSSVSELKIHSGKGYRIYYSKIGEMVVFLLAGGDKSTQRRDIKKAEEILKRMLDERKED
jgi:putative addiction module killer protein